MAFLYDALSRASLSVPESVAFEIIGASEQCWTYENLKKDVDALAELLSQSVDRSDIVGISDGTLSLQFLATLALDKLNIASTAVQSDTTSHPYWVTRTIDVDSLKRATDSGPFKPIDSTEPDASRRLVRIISTSGSTGRPKGVAFSNEIIANRVHEYERHFGGLFDGRSELLCLMGLPSSLGYLSLCYALNYQRAYVILDPKSPYPSNQLGREFSVVSSTPATLAEYWAIAKNGQSLSFTATSIIVSGGSIANAFCREIAQQFDASIYSLFGSTEAGLIAFAPVTALNLDRGEVGMLRDSCKLSSSSSDTEAMGFETEFVAPYCDDRIVSTGVVVPLSIWCSNDRCQMLESRVLKFDGRASDTVNSGGVKMALSEIEKAAIEFPHIFMACALMLPDALGIERVILALKSHQNLDRKAFADHYRSLFPEPLFPIRFFELDDFPMTSSGKIDRQKLRNFIMKNL